MTLPSEIPSTLSPPRVSSHALLLCIDDDEAVLACVTLILKKYGYRVLSALRGEIGIQIFKENAIDLVIVDYEMPGMNGCKVAEELRRLNAKVPIIMSSGNPEMPLHTGLVVDAYVPKGGEFGSLLSAITNLLAGKPASRQLSSIRLDLAE